MDPASNRAPYDLFNIIARVHEVAATASKNFRTSAMLNGFIKVRRK